MATVKKDGYASYYRGYGAGITSAWLPLAFLMLVLIVALVVATTIPATGLYFVAYEQRQVSLGDPDSVRSQFLSGVVAQFASSLVFTPRDVIKARIPSRLLFSLCLSPFELFPFTTFTLP